MGRLARDHRTHRPGHRRDDRQPTSLALPPLDPGQGETNGTLILRVTWHYWFHLGEGQAIRQLLGHTGLPDFVGGFSDAARYRPR